MKRQRMKHSKPVICALFGSLILFQALSAFSSPLLYKQPLSRKYQRMEILVDSGFNATCTSKPKRSVCRLKGNIIAKDLIQAYNSASLDDIKVNYSPRAKTLEFIFSDPKIIVQSRMLKAPARWIIELGYDEVLMGPIEEEIPFRPYPMAVQAIRLKPPTSAIEKLTGDDPEVVAFNRAMDLWQMRKTRAAWKELTQVDVESDPRKTTARSAERLKAEILYSYWKDHGSFKIEAIKYTGKEVFLQGSQFKLTKGQEIQLGYSVVGQTNNVTLSIKNSDNIEVFSANVNRGQDGQTLQVPWNGRDTDDVELPSGMYSFSVNAESDAEVLPQTRTYVRGRVSSGYTRQGTPYVTVNGTEYPLKDVIIPDQSGETITESDPFIIAGANDEASKKQKLGDIVAQHLQRAEDAARSEREKARYILLAAEVKATDSLPQATLFLEKAQGRYRGTEIEPFILAERARLLLEDNSEQEAEKVLNKINQFEGQHEHVMGSRLLALASIAYSRGLYPKAIALYDKAHHAYPALLTQEPGPLFQIAELYFRVERLDEAEIFYREFIERFPASEVNHLSEIAKLRLAQIESFKRPLAAELELTKLSNEMKEPESRNLTLLYLLRWANRGDALVDVDKVLNEIGSDPMSGFVYEEYLLHRARQALKKNRVAEAFKHTQDIWNKFPDGSLIRESSLIFQRTLLMEVDRLIRDKKDIDLALLYFKEKDRRFAQGKKTALLHLYVSRALRELKMLDESEKVITSNRGLGAASYDPMMKSLLNLELIGVLREKLQDNEAAQPKVVNHFKRAVESFTRDFFNAGKTLPYLDVYEVWASRGYYYELDREYDKAKEMYLFGLNGPMTKPTERIYLAQSIFNVYMKIPDYDKALTSLKVLLQIYDEFKKKLNMPRLRADTLWKIVELNLQQERWADVIGSITNYLNESQSMIGMDVGGSNKTLLDGGADVFVTQIDPIRRYEALYYLGYALLQFGDLKGAKRQWDLLSKEASNNTYGQLAELELKMLTWRTMIKGDLIKMISP